MTVKTIAYTYDKAAGTRSVEQTVVYTKADDMATLAQAIMSLSNLYRIAERAPVGTSAEMYDEKIAEAEKRVKELQEIVDGYEE